MLPLHAQLHIVVAAAAACVVHPAGAQTYPTQNITLQVAFAAGGIADVVARLVGQKLSERFGHATTTSLAVNETATKNKGFSVDDLRAIAIVAFSPDVLAVHPSNPAKDLKEFIAWLKANPDKATQGHPGFGTAAHVAGLLVQKETGTRFQSVPYRGVPALQDLVAGHIDLMITAEGLPQVRLGNVKAYAVMAKTRLAAAPDVPTVDEAGLPGYHVLSWHAIWAPKMTPKTVIAKLSAAVVDALADPTVRKRLADVGQDIFPREQQTPEALSAYHKAEIEKWWPLVKAANIKVE